MKPRLLDLFCGAGGCSKGYADAGFYVVGVDVEPQPNYPFRFIQADALEFLREGRWQGFDVIHASPPCQRYSAAAEIHDTSERHPDLIDPTRALLRATGLPWVMENVERAPLETTLRLCGSMFELGVLRHRLFESNVLMLGPIWRQPWRVVRVGVRRAMCRKATCHARRPRQADADVGQVRRRARHRSRGDGHRLDDPRRAIGSGAAELHGMDRIAASGCIGGRSMSAGAGVR